MADKRTEQVKSAMRTALRTGWTLQPGNTMLRKEEHQTPDNLPQRWWSNRVYESMEWISFTVIDGSVRSAIHSVSPTPWTERRDRKISVKRAIEILEGLTDE